MSESEIKELLDGIATKNGTAIRESVSAATKELRDAVEDQGIELKKLAGTSYGSTSSPLKRILNDQKSNIKGLADGDRRSLKFSVNKTAVARASVSNSTMALRLPDVGQLPTLEPLMRSLFNAENVGPSSNGTIRYYDQQAVTRNAATVAEAAQKPESAITWIERTTKIEKIADSIPISKEALADVGFIEGEIRRLLTINLGLKEDQQLYAGDGVTPNLPGVYTVAPAFAAVLGPTVTTPNILDLMAQLRLQIMNGKQSKYSPNVAIVNPIDFTALRLAKATDGHYVLPALVSGSNEIINIRVVESSQVTANTMLMGDFRYGTIYDLEDVSIEMGWINDQFIKNSMTILAEQRLALLIREADKDAFLKVTDITAALAALATP